MNESDSSDAHVDHTDAVGPPSRSGSPRGLRRADEHGLELIDAMAGRASVFGFGFEPIVEAIQAAAENYLGDSAAFADDIGGEDASFQQALTGLLGASPAVAADSIYLCPAADMAVEIAIGLARQYRPEKSFRTIAFLGSDHGRTGMCRTASGRPDLHEGYGPMMAGFAHVPPGDLDAIGSVADEQTACVLLSPIQMRNAARPCDKDYLAGLREICDQRGMLLVIDETQIMFGSSGRPFSFSAIADVRADIVIAAGGLFGGLAGGLVIAAQHVSGQRIVDVNRYPFLAAVCSQTLSSMATHELPGSALETMRGFAVALAERLSGFEFVRDVNVLGMTIGIETDIDSTNIVRTARRQGLLIERAGDTAVRIQPPLVMQQEEQQILLARLGATMEAMESETASLSL